MPKTNYGKWSVGLIIAMFVLFIVDSFLANTLNESAPTGDTVYVYFISRSILEIAMGLSFAAPIAAFINGLYSIVSQKERSLLVYASTIIGAAFTLFYIIKRLFPN